MFITRRLARALALTFIALLLFGTLMPGGWKEDAVHRIDLPVDLSMLAHVMLFAAICSVTRLAGFWRVNSWHIPVVGLVLALITEGLQFFAVDRHPNMAGLAQDMIGALIGWALSGRLGGADAGGSPVSPSAWAAHRPAAPSAGAIPVRVSQRNGK